jgi:hypothetical protein
MRGYRVRDSLHSIMEIEAHVYSSIMDIHLQLERDLKKTRNKTPSRSLVYVELDGHMLTFKVCQLVRANDMHVSLQTQTVRGCLTHIGYAGRTNSKNRVVRSGLFL